MRDLAVMQVNGAVAWGAEPPSVLGGPRGERVAGGGDGRFGEDGLGGCGQGFAGGWAGPGQKIGQVLCDEAGLELCAGEGGMGDDGVEERDVAGEAGRGAFLERARHPGQRRRTVPVPDD